MPKKKQSKTLRIFVRIILAIVGIVASVIVASNLYDPIIKNQTPILIIMGIIVGLLLVLGWLTPKRIGKKVQEAIGI